MNIDEFIATCESMKIAEEGIIDGYMGWRQKMTDKYHGGRSKKPQKSYNEPKKTTEKISDSELRDIAEFASSEMPKLQSYLDENFPEYRFKCKDNVSLISSIVNDTDITVISNTESVYKWAASYLVATTNARISESNYRKLIENISDALHVKSGKIEISYTINRYTHDPYIYMTIAQLR